GKRESVMVERVWRAGKRSFSATGRGAANNDSRFAYRDDCAAPAAPAAPAARAVRTSRAAR
ncbi:TPA: hypothetical protein ACYLIL_000198, partial [Burkholderia cenocepacia]